MLQRRIRSALYIDWANIVSQFPSRTLVTGLPAWLAWLEDGKFDPAGRRRKFLEKCAYINQSYLSHGPILEAAGFKVIPSSADMLIALDVADSLHGDKAIKEYVLLTVDEDFVHLLARLGDRGKKRVVTINEKDPCARSFPPLSEITIPLDVLQRAFRYERHRPFRDLVGRLRSRWFRTTRRKTVEAPAPTNPRMRAIADQVAVLAHSKAGVAVGKNSVLRHLQRNIPGFHPYPYSYRPRYNRLLRRVAAIRTDLQLFRNARGQLAIMAPAPDDQSAGAGSDPGGPQSSSG
jgi:hypothetical protein